MQGKLFIKNKLIVSVSLTNVQSLKLANFRKGALTETALISVIDSCPQLTALHVDNVDCFNDKVIKYMKGSILQQLQHIKLSDCAVQLTRRSIEHITSQCRRLSWIGFKFSPHCNITEEDIMRLVEVNAAHIQRLSFPAAHVTDRMMQHIATHCVQLRSFYANDCTVSLCGLAAVMTHCKALTGLVLHTMDRGLVMFNVGERVYTKPKKSIQISRLVNGTSGAGGASDTNHLLSLLTKVGDFSDIHISSVGSALNDAVLMAIARHNPRLSHLMVSGVQDCHYSAVSLRQIVLHCQLLTHIDLKGFNLLCGEDLVELFAIPSKICSISLEKHDTLDANCANHIIKHIGNHENTAELTLNLGGCPKLDKAMVQAYVKRCHSITSNMKVTINT